MNDNFEAAERIPANMADVALLVASVTIEIVAALTPDSKTADEKLEDIASRFLDMLPLITEPRSRTLFGTFAEKLVRTEQGSA